MSIKPKETVKQLSAGTLSAPFSPDRSWTGDDASTNYTDASHEPSLCPDPSSLTLGPRSVQEETSRTCSNSPKTSHAPNVDPGAPNGARNGAFDPEPRLHPVLIQRISKG